MGMEEAANNPIGGVLIGLGIFFELAHYVIYIWFLFGLEYYLFESFFFYNLVRTLILCGPYLIGMGIILSDKTPIQEIGKKKISGGLFVLYGLARTTIYNRIEAVEELYFSNDLSYQEYIELMDDTHALIRVLTLAMGLLLLAIAVLRTMDKKAEGVLFLPAIYQLSIYFNLYDSIGLFRTGVFYRFYYHQAYSFFDEVYVIAIGDESDSFFFGALVFGISYILWGVVMLISTAAYDEGETLSQNFYSTGTGGVAAAQFSGQTTMSSSDAGPIEPSRHPYTLRTSSLLGLTKFNLTVDDYFITATKRGGLINKQHSSFIIRRKDVHAIENGAYVRSNAWSRNVMIGFVAFSILTVFWGAILLPLFIYIALRGKAELSLRYLVVTPGYPAINYGRLTFPREGVRTRFMQLSNSVFRDLTFDDPQYVIYLKSGFTGKSSLRVFGYYVEVEKTSGIFPRTQNIVFPLRNIISVRTDPLKRRSNKMAFIGFLLCLTLFGIVIGLPLVIIGLSKRTKLKVVYSLIGGDVGEVQIEGKFGGSMQQLYEYSNRLFSIAELRRGGHRR